MAETLGTRLRAARITKGLSQQDVADAVGVNRVRVSNWETDQHKPGADNLERLASLLGVATRALLYGGEDKAARNENVSRGTSVTGRAGGVVREGLSDPAPRHLRNLPLEVRVYLDELRLRLTKAEASEDEVDRAMTLLRSQSLFTWYSTGTPRELSPDKILKGMRAITENVILPELRERGRKV